MNVTEFKNYLDYDQIYPFAFLIIPESENPSEEDIEKIDSLINDYRNQYKNIIFATRYVKEIEKFEIYFEKDASLENIKHFYNDLQDNSLLLYKVDVFESTSLKVRFKPNEYCR